MHKMKKIAFFLVVLLLALALFGCTTVSIDKYSPKEPIDGFDASELGYGNSFLWTDNSYFFLIDTYTYETKLNGDYYKIVSKSFFSASDASKKFDELAAGFTILDTNNGKAAVLGNKGLSYYASSRSGNWVVEITAPDNNKASILATRFVEKIKYGIKKETNVMDKF
jgi:hypothetical protein